MKQLVRSALHAIGFDIVRSRQPSNSVSRPSPDSVSRPSSESVRLPPDLSTQDRAILERVAGFTMTSIERQMALVQAVRYLVRQGVEGCFVECGVWRGG